LHNQLGQQLMFAFGLTGGAVAWPQGVAAVLLLACCAAALAWLLARYVEAPLRAGLRALLRGRQRADPPPGGALTAPSAPSR
jgi:peptidoglycan/LPS O-acetylase OafA/YrhL